MKKYYQVGMLYKDKQFPGVFMITKTEWIINHEDQKDIEYEYYYLSAPHLKYYGIHESVKNIWIPV